MLPDINRQTDRNYKAKNKSFHFAPERRRIREQLRKRTIEDQPREVEKQEIQKKEVNKGPIHNCPLTKQNFRGPCAIMQCNFNITSYKQNESCCLIIQNGGKEHFDKWDLQNTLDITESKLYKLKEQGNRKASCILLLNKILDYVREQPVLDAETENFSQISNFIGNSHLSLKELNVKVSDVIQIKNHLDKIEEIIKESGYEYTLSEILGSDKPLP